MADTLKRKEDVFSLKVPRGKAESVYFDEGKPKDRVSGLALRIRSAGSRKFVFFYRLGGRLLKQTIGDASSWTFDQARAEARKLRVQVDKGENPATAKTERSEANRLTFSAVMEDYLKARARHMKPRSHEESTRHLRQHWKPLHGLPIGSVSRSVVAARLRVLADEKGPVAADRARSTLSALYAWAIGEGICDTNPVIGTNKASDDKPRDRVLSDDELVIIWKAAPENAYGRIVRLLMLTAQRREEIGGLRWSEVDTEAKAIVLPGERTKNSRAHAVPLSDTALDVLDEQPRRAGRDSVFGEGEGG
jgi:integrase